MLKIAITKKTLRRTLSVTITKDCTVKVIAPKFVSDDYIYKFLQKHKEWIDNKIEECKNSFILYEHTDMWPLWGNYHPIKLVKKATEPIKYSKPYFYIDKKLFKQNKSIFRRQVYMFYKTQLKPKLIPRLRVYLGAINQDFNKLYIRNSLRRWGSCSPLKNLNFSFRLAWLPLRLVDYIIAHEVAHLVYMNHTKAFWGLVERLDKHYKKHRKELRKWERVRVI